MDFQISIGLNALLQSDAQDDITHSLFWSLFPQALWSPAAASDVCNSLRNIFKGDAPRFVSIHSTVFCKTGTVNVNIITKDAPPPNVAKMFHGLPTQTKFEIEIVRGITTFCDSSSLRKAPTLLESSTSR